MESKFSRSEQLFGKEAIELLSKSHIAIFGVGGVGGYVAEALARTGVGHFTLIDNDKVSLSNINRQIIATMDTLGKDKVDVMKDRILSINPDVIVEVKKCFFLPELKNEFDFAQYDYVVDAIDTVKAKIALVELSDAANTPIISSMGAGNKVNPMGFVITDINKTDTDPLAKVIRYELKKRGIKKLKVVYSKEKPLTPLNAEIEKGKIPPGSNAFVPSAVGLLIASEVIRDLINEVTRVELKR
jgi:tRNA threonylcarbamoyladenosine dehydratase